MPFEAFSRRLHRHYQVSSSDLARLEQMPCNEQSYRAGDRVIERGDSKDELLLVQQGWAARCRYTPAGSRQIVHVLVPGDMITPDVAVTASADHEVVALEPSVIRAYRREVIQELMIALPGLTAGLWWSMAQEEGMLREQIVRLGRRSALERICHLFLDLHRRLELVALTEGKTMRMPLTQTDIADILGLSAVHTNRTLRQLVRLGHIDYDGQHVTLRNQQEMAALGDYDSRHLHLDATASAYPGQ
jgi:CRP-like cAMP-binding protein